MKVLYFALVLTLVAAEDLSGGGDGTNLELAKGYTFSGQIDGSGRPGGAAYAYLGGKVSPVSPQTGYYDNQQSTYLAPSSTYSLWSHQLTAATFFAAGVVGALSIWYICSVIALPHSKKSVDELDDAKSLDSDDSSPSTTKDSSEKAKSRRRREVRQQDEEMTRLASIVLAAVQSGECLQRSICLLGSQMTDKKRGKLADSLLSTLLPESIQQSDYYIILRKSLRGEVSCEKYGCIH